LKGPDFFNQNLSVIMSKIKDVDLSSIENKFQKVAFDLFRFWTKEMDINESLIIKTEQLLVSDLKDSISKAVVSLYKRKDLHEKPLGWDIGYIIGFIKGNLGSYWYHEYVIKNGPEFKEYSGLSAVYNYLRFEKLAELNIDKIYEFLLNQDSNISNMILEVNEIEISKKNLNVTQNARSGKILTILNNMMVKQLKVLAEMENRVKLTINTYFTTAEIEKLIADNFRQI